MIQHFQGLLRLQRQLYPPLIGSLLVLVTWSLAAALTRRWSPELAPFVPGPGEVARSGVKMTGSSDFWLAMAASNFRVLAGFLVGAVLAIPLGALAGAFRQFDRFVSPVLDFCRYIPVAALVPLLILWAGVGDLQKIAVLAIGTFFQVFVLVADAIRRVPVSHIESARTLGISRKRIVTRVLVPAASPEIFDACRVGMGLTWSYLLVAEIVAAQQGLGYVIIRSQRFLQADRIFFIIIVLGLLGLVYDRAFTLTRGPLFPWAKRGSA